MTDGRYPRSRIEPVLATRPFPESYRIVPQRHVESPLGTTAADSRFAQRTGGHTVPYAAPDFTTAFMETIVRDRFAHRRSRKVALREIRERVGANSSEFRHATDASRPSRGWLYAHRGADRRSPGEEPCSRACLRPGHPY